MNNEEKLKRINLEKAKVEKQIEDHEKTLPDLIELIFEQKLKLEEILSDIGLLERTGKDDLEWLADDIIDHASALASSVRKLSQCQ